MALTYKTVITNAIKGFNDIQSKLATLTDLGISAVSSSTTSGVTTVSNSITPTNMVDAIGKVATIKKSDGSFISGKVTYRGSANATVNPTISRSENIVTVTFSKSLAGAGYYTGGTISNGTSNTLTIPAGSITATPSVSQKTYDGTSTTALSTDILQTTAPSSYYKITMDPSVSISIGTDGYHSASVGTRTAASGTTLTRYIQKGSVTSSISGTNPTVTPSTSISGTIANYGITTEKPTSGTDGTNYLTITPGGSSNSQTFTAGMTFTAGYIASKGTEGTKSVSATVSTSGTKHYIPIVTPAFGGGVVTSNAALANSQTNATLTTSTTSGIAITATSSGSSTAVLYNGAKQGLINISDNTQALAAKTSATTANSATKYLSSITVASSNTLTSVTNNGTITTLNGTGTISTQSGSQSVTSNTGTITVGTNTGTVQVTTPSTGTVKYTANWIIVKDSSGNLTFTYSA